MSEKRGVHPLLPLLPAHTCPHVQRSERSAPLFHSLPLSLSLSSFLPPRCASKSLRGLCICCVVSFHERLLCFSLPPSLSLCLCACTHTHRHTQRNKREERNSRKGDTLLMPSLTLTMLNAKLVSSTRARLHPLNSSTPPPRGRERR